MTKKCTRVAGRVESEINVAGGNPVILIVGPQKPASCVRQSNGGIHATNNTNNTNNTTNTTNAILNNLQKERQNMTRKHCTAFVCVSVALLLAITSLATADDSQQPTTDKAANQVQPKPPKPVFKDQKYVIYDVQYLRDPENKKKYFIVARLHVLHQDPKEQRQIKTAALVFDQDVTMELADLTFVDKTFNVVIGGGGGTNWRISAAKGKVTGIGLEFTHASAQYTQDDKGVLNLTINGLEAKQYGFMIHEDFKPVSNVVPFKVGDFRDGDGSTTYKDFLLDVKFPRPPAKWPVSEGQLTGQMEVRISNPNPSAVRVGLRSNGQACDFVVPGEATKSASVPNGPYQIYFQFADKPDQVLQGDKFTLKDYGVEIQIVKVVNGNYNIREVE